LPEGSTPPATFRIVASGPCRKYLQSENAFMLCLRFGALKTSEKWWPVYHFEQSSSPV
jgi:hypothetical protein